MIAKHAGRHSAPRRVYLVHTQPVFVVCCNFQTDNIRVRSSSIVGHLTDTIAASVLVEKLCLRYERML